MIRLFTPDKVKAVCRPSNGFRTLESLAGAVLLFGTGLATTAQAAHASPQASAASAETFQDWQVACGLRAGKKLCSAIQQEAVGKEANAGVRQRLLAIEIVPETSGASGTLLLPFGLDLTKGATLRLGENGAGPPLPFRTCIAAGCMVRLEFSAQALAALRAGEVLTVSVAEADSGRVIDLPISLAGFDASFDRAKSLAQPG